MMYVLVLVLGWVEHFSVVRFIQSLGQDYIIGGGGGDNWESRGMDVRNVAAR